MLPRLASSNKRPGYDNETLRARGYISAKDRH